MKQINYQEFCEQYNINELNSVQQDAVKSVKGHTLLFSVPGSGKTTVIVMRTGYMLLCQDIEPSNILTMTFSKAAAGEMKARFLKRFPEFTGNPPMFCTIHSFCYSVLNNCRRNKTEHIPKLLSNNKPAVLAACVKLCEEYPSEALVSEIASQIGRAKNLMFKNQELKNIDIPGVDFFAIYKEYQSCIEREDYMDFSDMQLLALKYLKKYPDLLGYYQNMYSYISVDEAQDTSLVQHIIVEILVGKTGNLFMVGDDDQSIYGFQGAYPEYILQFKERYRDARLMKMETNYRSGSQLIALADSFIKNNRMRAQKDMKPAVSFQGSAERIKIESFTTQYSLIREEIKRCVKSGKTMAVLYRQNDSEVPLLCCLMEENIHVKMRDRDTLFFSYFLTKDIIDMISFSKDLRNMEIFSRLYYKFGLYLPKACLSQIQKILIKDERLNIFDAILELPDYIDKKKEVKENLDVLNFVAEKDMISAIQAIYYISGYKKYIKKKIDEGISESGLKFKLNILLNLAADCKTSEELFEKIERVKNYPSDLHSWITLSTMHGSKGLEFDKVIIIDGTEGIIPSLREGMGSLEEERRLFYVAVTRARKEVTFIDSKQSINGERPSRFITEYFSNKTQNQQEDYTAYKVGTIIIHSNFGEGIIKAKEKNDTVRVEFKNSTKLLNLRICTQNRQISVKKV